HSWPGNVRELENVIERAVILSPGTDLEVAAEALPASASTATNETAPPTVIPRHETSSDDAVGDGAGQTLAEMERAHIIAVLNQTNWRIDGPSGAASALNLNPSTLRSRMKKLGIRRSSHQIS
ncbi:MAG: helix-turn-helix domain-containing protein, partial [Candidatus Binataceae bacterium]